MKIKVMSYNVKRGFFDESPRGGYRKSVSREALATEVIVQANPDILIIPEACAAMVNGVKKKITYKKIFGYKYEVYGSDIYEDFDWGVSILSRYPIIKSYDYTTKHSRWVRAIINVNGKEIMVDGVHPDPYHNEHQRMQWFKTVVRDRKIPYIIAGDFNAFSPQDKYDKKNLTKGFQRNFGAGKENLARETVSRILKGDTIKFLLESGLRDTFREKNKGWNYTYHTSMSDNPYDYSRIDYIFCSDDFKVLESGIVKDEPTEKASDHYPIYSVLEIY